MSMSGWGSGVVAIIGIRASGYTGSIRSMGIVSARAVLNTGASGGVGVVCDSSADGALCDTEVGRVISKERRENGACLDAKVRSCAVLAVP